MKRALWLPAVALAAVVAWSVALAAGVRVNWTASLPVGLWLLDEAPTDPHRGQVLEFCLPAEIAALAQARGYVGTGACPDGTMPLLKPAEAIPGDVVEISAGEVRVNGRFIVPAGLDRDTSGRALKPAAPGRYVVPPGEVWMLSSYAVNSFDARYWGPIPMTRVLRSATPLLTF